MSELKRCYHCGGDAVTVESYNAKVKKYLPAVKCLECGCRTTTFNSFEEAIDAWNARKQVEKVVEKLEELKNDFIENIPDGDYLRGNVNFAVNAIEIVKEWMD